MKIREKAAKKDCKTCHHPDCPNSLVNRHSFDLRVSSADLYNTSIDLMDMIVAGGESVDCHWPDETRESGRVRRKKNRKLEKEVALLTGSVESLTSRLENAAERLAAAEAAKLSLANAVAETRERIEDVKWTGTSGGPGKEVQDRLGRVDARLLEVERKVADKGALEELAASLSLLESESARRAEVVALQARLTELAGAAAGVSDFADVSQSLDELRLRQKEDASRLSARLDEMASHLSSADEVFAAREELESLKSEQSKEVERLGGIIGEESARLLESFSELEQGLGNVRSDLVPTEEFAKVRGRVEELWLRFADRDFVSEIADRVDEIGDAYAGKVDLESLAARLESIAGDYAAKRELLGLAELVKELVETAARASALKELGLKVDTIADSYADRDVMEALRDELGHAAAKIAALAQSSAGKIELADLSARLEEVAATAARRSEVEGLQARLAKLSFDIDAAAKNDTERAGALETRVARLESDTVRAESFEKIESSLMDQKAETASALERVEGRIAARLDRMAEKVSGLDAGAATREDILEIYEKMKALARELVAVRDGSAKQVHLEKTVVELLDLKATAAQKDLAFELRDQISELREQLTAFKLSSTAPNRLEGADQSGLVNELARRVSEMESRVDAVESQARVEDRVQLTEIGLRSAEPVSSERARPAAASSRPGEKALDEALVRLKAVEEENFELRRQIKKAFDDSTAYTVKELVGIRRKISVLELEKAGRDKPRLMPAPPPALRPVRLRAKTWFKAAMLVFALFSAAGLVGVVSALHRGGGEEKGPAPNVVYDGIDQPISSPVLDIGFERLKLSDGKADITGYAPGGLHAYLFVNNREAGYCAVEHDGFRFQETPLEYGVNVVQVKSIDAVGNEANSMAGIVERLSLKAARVHLTDAINRMRGPVDAPLVALTIDAGASDRRAEEVLDVLREHGIVTTIFLTGGFIERYPGLVRRIVEDGHEVGNHTYSHPHLTTFETNRRHHTVAGMNRRRLQDELIRTKELFENCTGSKMSQWWRAPYGEHNEEILAWALEIGFHHVDWTRTPKNLDMLDWVSNPSSRNYLDSDGLLRRLTGIDDGIAGRANGAIILAHLGSDRKRDFLDQVLPSAIFDLRSRGYSFVTVSRMFSD